MVELAPWCGASICLLMALIEGAYCDSSSQFNKNCEKIEEWMLTKKKKLKDSWDEEEDSSIRRLK
jgi:hypothetical protein